MNKLNLYRKFHYGFFSWLMFSFYIPWGVFAIATLIILYDIIKLYFQIDHLLVLLPLTYGFLQGWYHHSIESIIVSLWHTWLAEDGIYGMRFFERFYILKKTRLMAKWEDIEKVVFKAYHFNRSMGSIRIYLKNGNKFRISFFRVTPYNWSYYNIQKFNEGSDEGISLEMAAIIAWKVGVDKLEGFPENEGVTSTNKRENIISIEGIRRVIRVLERGGIEFEGETNIY